MSTRVTPSLLASWGKCPKQTEYSYVLRIKSPPGIAAEFGSSMHETLIEKDQRNRIEKGGYLPVDELKEVFSNEFDRRILETDPFDRDAVELGGHVQARNTLQRWGFSAIDRYNENRDMLAGRAVEVPFSIPFGNGTLEGRIDVDVSATAFKDLKTRDLSRPRSKRVTPAGVAYSMQFAAYAAAKARIEKEPDITLSQVTLYKREKALPLEEIMVVRTALNHEATEEYASIVQRSIEAGVFTPVDRSSTAAWVCSPRFCGYWADPMPNGMRGCPFGQRASVSIATKGSEEE